MKAKILFSLALSILLITICEVSFAESQGVPPHVSGKLLAQAKAGAHADVLYKIFDQNGASLEDRIPGINTFILKVPEDKLEIVEKALSHNPNFDFVEKNFLAKGSYAPNDSSYGSQWHLPKIMASQGWDISTGSQNVIIAIVDSGVDPAHPDLASKLLPGYNYVNGNTDTHDVLGHGTAVAGTSAAISDNYTGVAGVAWQNPILPLVVLNASDYASYSNIASAIIYAADHGAKAINVSIGGSSSSSTLQSAMDYAWNKGAIVVASAMNNSSSTPMYPAACNHAIAVSATDSNDNLASFSNFGTWIDLAAPGVSILTTTNGGGYGYWSGTSFSSPIIAGIVAMVFSVNPSLTNQQVEDLLKQNSDDLGTAGFDTSYGYGRVNLYKVLSAASGTAPALDRTPPSATITSPVSVSTVSNTVSINVSATDNMGVTKVDLYLNGAFFSSDTASPFSFSWNTLGYANGSNSLTAYAYDAAGNSAGSNQVIVQVSNMVDVTAPNVSITSPGNGTTASGTTMTISVSASDDTAVSKVEFYIDGKLSGTLTTSPYIFKWNIRKTAKGAHNLQAKAYDTAGNSATSTMITVYK